MSTQVDIRTIAMSAFANPSPEMPREEVIYGLPTSDIPAASSLAERLVSRLLLQRRTLITAESCTAGKLAHLISEVSGAALVLEGGFVVYTKHAKVRMLGVERQLIRDFTAVSEAVARAMVAGALEKSDAGLAIALTGITGSEPDEDGNPLGRVHVVAGLRDDRQIHRHCEFGSVSPDVLIHAAMQMALLSALQAVDQA